MRIVHLSTSDTGGGAARAAYRVHTGLRRLGHESWMLVAKRLSNDPSVLPFQPEMDLMSRIRRKFRARRIWKEFDQFRATRQDGFEPFSDDRTADAGDVVKQIPACDIINLHWVAGLVDYERFFAAAPDVPLVWRLADMAAFTGGCHYDHHCGKFAQRCGACPQLGSRLEHDLSREVWQRKNAALRALAPNRLHIVATSNWIADQARRSSLMSEFPVTVIPNGLDVDEFAPRDRGFSRDLWGIAPNVKVVMFAAESIINRRKGLTYLIDALAGLGDIPNLLLVSVGGGKPEIGAAVGHLPLGKIANDRILSTIYSAADVFVIPSIQESFGQTVIESLACGTPVIGFNTGGIPDMVRPGKTGWLAETANTQSLRDAIAAALSDTTRLREMGRACRAVAVEEYSLNVQSRAYARLYETLIDARAGATQSTTAATGAAVGAVG